MNNPIKPDPFVTLWDISGGLMCTLGLCVIFAALGSRSITGSVVAVVAVLFFGAVHFAKKG